MKSVQGHSGSRAVHLQRGLLHSMRAGRGCKPLFPLDAGLRLELMSASRFYAIIGCAQDTVTGDIIGDAKKIAQRYLQVKGRLAIPRTVYSGCG